MVVISHVIETIEAREFKNRSSKCDEEGKDRTSLRALKKRNIVGARLGKGNWIRASNHSNQSLHSRLSARSKVSVAPPADNVQPPVHQEEGDRKTITETEQSPELVEDAPRESFMDRISVRTATSEEMMTSDACTAWISSHVAPATAVYYYEESDVVQVQPNEWVQTDGWLLPEGCWVQPDGWTDADTWVDGWAHHEEYNFWLNAESEAQPQDYNCWFDVENEAQPQDYNCWFDMDPEWLQSESWAQPDDSSWFVSSDDDPHMALYSAQQAAFQLRRGGEYTDEVEMYY